MTESLHTDWAVSGKQETTRRRAGQSTATGRGGGAGEENMRLAQQISELSQNNEDQEACLVEQQVLKETIARLENEAEERDRQLDAYKARLEAAQGDIEALTT